MNRKRIYRRYRQMNATSPPDNENMTIGMRRPHFQRV